LYLIFAVNFGISFFLKNITVSGFGFIVVTVIYRVIRKVHKIISQMINQTRRKRKVLGGVYYEIKGNEYRNKLYRIGNISYNLYIGGINEIILGQQYIMGDRIYLIRRRTGLYRT
jgi:hypothetical protein